MDPGSTFWATGTRSQGSGSPTCNPYYALVPRGQGYPLPIRTADYPKSCFSKCKPLFPPFKEQQCLWDKYKYMAMVPGSRAIPSQGSERRLGPSWHQNSLASRNKKHCIARGHAFQALVPAVQRALMPLGEICESLFGSVQVCREPYTPEYGLWPGKNPGPFNIFYGLASMRENVDENVARKGVPEPHCTAATRQT
ncbi:hypothetical protein B0H13DRAFT_1868058 [Mycena leptocephala]|nr:hypothetical protein B0H13DRAFT_1868058 [Mycena leptocephala]